MNTPYFSIIVPVYNTENFLTRCVESILQQDMVDFELILVNDGSTDNCPSMCDSFAIRDKRVKVIHQKNVGVSAARNAALDMAKGQWIWFIDSDDYIVPGALSILKRESCEDLLVFNTNLNEQFEGSYDLVLETHYFTYHLGFGPCNKLYRHSIIKTHQLKFDTEESIGEDLLFNLHYYCYCQKLNFLNKKLYIYDIREGSAMTSLSRNRHVNQMRLFRKIRHLLQHKISPLNMGILYFMHLISGLNQSAEGGLSRQERAKQARNYRLDFPGDRQLYKRALSMFLKNEHATLLGKLNLQLLLLGF
ncbi:MAG: glycosyltransferase [Akkermansia sp.]|nr:glycosyltransferase [Akkermansia sp.]